jgi:hypothetical protein
MTASITPNIGAQGVYTLAAPFAALVIPNITYTCRAIRKLEDIIGSGEDPYETYYKPFNLSKEDFLRNLNNNDCIVSLQSSAANWIYVPSSYILAYPSGAGVKYQAMMIGVSLGTIPSSINLSNLETEIKDLVYHSLGVEATTKQVVVSADLLIDNDTSETLETIRNNRKVIKESSALTIARQASEITTLQTKLSELERFITTNFVRP